MMLQENQGQYLNYKNIQNSTTQKYRSQVVYTNRNIYTTNQNSKKFTGKGRTQQKSHSKQIIPSKPKIYQQSTPKSPRSNCEVISFSTDSTKKNQPTQNLKYTNVNEKQNVINMQLENQHNKGRVTKAKSSVNILKTFQKFKTEENLSNKLIEEIMQDIPSKYQTDFKISQNQPNQDEITPLIKTIKFYQAKIERLQKQLKLKNHKIAELQKANSQKTKQQWQIQSYLKPDNRYHQEQNRENVRRLLKMLQMTDQYKEFAQFGLQDNGMTLLHQANKKNKTKIDCENQESYKKSMKLHYCSCNKQFIPEPYLWVPESIYEYGKDFLKTRQNQLGQMNGFLSRSEYELLLYEMNRMWRERQKRIVNTITHEKNMQIQKLKRKYNVNPTDRLNSARKNSKH